MSPHTGDPPPKRLTDRFLFLLLGFILAIPFASFGISFFADNAVELLRSVALGLTAGVAVSAFLFIARERLLNRVFGTASTDLDAMARSLKNGCSSLAEQEVGDATNHFLDAVRVLLARYTWLRARAWILGALLATLASFGALAASGLLFKQNAILASQSALLAEQNQRLTHQNALLEGQTLAVRSQEWRELGSLEHELGSLETSLANLRKFYEVHRDKALTISGRAARIGEPPPAQFEFTVRASDFRLGVCSDEFLATASSELTREQCLGSDIERGLDVLREPEFDDLPHAKSVLSLLTYLADIAVSRNDVEQFSADLSDDWIEEAAQLCGYPPSRAARLMHAQSTLRTIEKVAQQLYALHQFHYSGRSDTKREQELLHHRARLSLLMTQLSELRDELETGETIVGTGFAQFEGAQTIGGFEEELAASYIAIALRLEDLLDSCKTRHASVVLARQRLDPFD